MERTQDMKQRLEEYLKGKFPQREELSVVEVQRLTTGVSHQNYLVTLSWREAQGPVSENLYIRLEPGFGRALEHDFTSQYEALKRLYGTGVPVPKVYWVEMDSKLLGRPFGVMEKLEGEVLPFFYRNHPEHQAQLRKDYVEVIAKIHGLDWQALGLSSFLGVPENDRQRAEEAIAMMEQLVEANEYGPQPVMTELFSWLKRNVSRAERTTFCHGDCHVGNFFVRDGRIIAVLDWESASIGNPMLDIGWSCMMMRTVYKDFWDETEFIRAYEEVAGVKVNKESLFFWEVLAFVRLIGVGFIGIKTGLESEDLDMRQLGIWPVLVPLLQDEAARMLGF